MITKRHLIRNVCKQKWKKLSEIFEEGHSIQKIKAISHQEKASKILSSKKLDILEAVTGLKGRDLTEIFR